MPLRGSMMQIAAAPAAAVAASAAARVACDTAAAICISDGPCGREAWDCRSVSMMLENKKDTWLDKWLASAQLCT